MATRATSTSPVDMPPSMPPALVLSRRYSACGVPDDGVVGLAPPPAGHVEAVADLDALDRLDAHERLGQQGVELAVPVHVAAEADRHAVGEHLDDAPQGVAVLLGRLDLVDHGGLGRRVEAAHLGGVDGEQVGRDRDGTRPPPGRCRAAPRGSPTSTPRWPRRALATAPAATRAAVSRAEARSSTLRASAKSYFCMPARSAWPGRGVVSRCAVRPGWGDISSATCGGPTRCWRSRWPPASRACARGGHRRGW